MPELSTPEARRLLNGLVVGLAGIEKVLKGVVDGKTTAEQAAASLQAIQGLRQSIDTLQKSLDGRSAGVN
jgi:hypothetical protein